MDMTELRLTDVGAPSSRAELGQTTMQTAMPQRADLPAQVARQLAEALPQTQNRPVEITLSPEELGRVRLSLTLSESQVTVNLLAERPETLDLLRRHIDMLGEEFRALGYENIAFAFGGEGGSTSADTGTGQNADGAPSGGDAPDTSTVVALQSGAVTGLDLRL